MSEYPPSDRHHVDILCVVDGESILTDYPNTKDLVGSGNGVGNRKVFHPNGGIEKYCRMVTRDSSAALADHRVDANLQVRAESGNIVRWRATSLTLDEEYRVEIDGFYDHWDGGRWVWGDRGICKIPQRVEALAADEYYWWTEITGRGQDSYWLKFRVIRRPSAGKPEIGYFDWDPGIVVE